MENKHVNSKYLGKSFNGWKVVDAIETKGKHIIFKLQKYSVFKQQTMTVRDNYLTKLSNNIKDTSQLIKGKNYQLDKNVRIPKNTINSRYGFYLFKKVGGFHVNWKTN